MVDLSSNQLRPQSRPAATTIAAAGRARRYLLVCPWEQRGGGMGRIMGYLLQTAQTSDASPRYEAIDSRGPWHGASSPLFVLWAMARIAAGVIKRDIAVVHVNVAERLSLFRKGVLVFFARMLRLPVVLHLHAAQLIAFYEGLPRPVRALVRAMFRSADCCIVLGETWQRFVIDELGVDPAKVVILYNGVPRAATPRKAGPSAGPLKILFLGNLLERKGVSDLLQALAREPLAAVDWRATFAGGGQIDHYRGIAERLGIGDKVTFPGWVDQSGAAALLSQSDVLVLPAYDEGLPLVILEALTAGVPVVCSPVGSIPEVLEDGNTALFVQPGDIKGLTETLARLARDPELQLHLVAQGRALYDREFSIEVFAERVAGIYRRYCGVDTTARVS